MPTISMVSLSTVRFDLASSTSRHAPWSTPATPTVGASAPATTPASARAPTCCMSLIASSRSAGGGPGGGNDAGTGRPRSSAPILAIIWSSDTRTSPADATVIRPPVVAAPEVVGAPLTVERPSITRATSSSHGRRCDPGPRVTPNPELKSPEDAGGVLVIGLSVGRPCACRAASSRRTSATSTLCLRKWSYSFW